MNLTQLSDAVRKYLEENIPGRTPLRIGIITAEDRKPIILPILAAVKPAASLRNGFVPTPFQEGILDALEGKALRSDPLGAAVGDKRRLYRHPGGLQELREEGLVDHHARLGYFRPDAPPPELSGDE
ncbi:MAG TPA: hypothetical protein VH682_24650 [Gemmataceae bacterium]|jgi:hypothetical protein